MADQTEPTPDSDDVNPANAEVMLLEFVHRRDVECPRCGYNLRALTQPRCPECREPLQLQVGVVPAEIGWLVATIIPGTFSGIAAFILMLPMLLVPLIGGGSRAPLPFFILDGFGWISGIWAVAIYIRRQRFVRLSTPAQATWAIAVWFIHLAAFGMLAAIIV